MATEVAAAVERFTDEQVESFWRDGFLIVEGLIADRALERLRERYLPLFDGEYETGIRPTRSTGSRAATPRTGRASSATRGSRTR